MKSTEHARTQPQAMYTVQEVSERSGLTPHTLRYYEKEGILQNIPRNRSGHRRFRSTDIDWIGFVKCLKGTGMNLEDIKRFAGLHWQGDSNPDEQMEILLSHREKVLHQMKELSAMLERIDHKIAWFTQKTYKE
ncbi:MAG: MerR family transcriptional regulator [Spirochaeta sp.]